MKNNSVWALVVISCVMFASRVCYSGTIEESADTIALMGDATKAPDLNEDLVVNGAKVVMRHYRIPRSLEELVKFYRTVLPRQGWRIEESNVQASAHSMQVFHKKGIYLYVVSERDLRSLYHHMVNRSLAPLSFYLRQHDTSSLPDEDVYLCFSESSIEICKTLGIVDFEMPGSDPEQIPVYPGAVRKTSIERLSTGGGFFVYETPSDISAITEYYRFKMQFFGWQNDASEPLTEELIEEKYGFVPDKKIGSYGRVDGHYLSFSKEGDHKSVDIVITQRGFLNSRLINIYY